MLAALRDQIELAGGPITQPSDRSRGQCCLGPSLTITSIRWAAGLMIMRGDQMLDRNDGLVLGVAANADTSGVTATGEMFILGKESVTEVEASLGRFATEGLLVASDESPRWFVTDAGRQAATRE